MTDQYRNPEGATFCTCGRSHLPDRCPFQGGRLAFRRGFDVARARGGRAGGRASATRRRLLALRRKGRS